MKIVKASFLLLTVIFLTCKKKDKLALASVTTLPIYSISSYSAVSGGYVSGEVIQEKGVCWSTDENPDTGDNKTSDGSGPEGYKSKLFGLLPQTVYYVRAYATNGAGTAYGEQLSFKTLSLPAPVLPTIKTVGLITISQTLAQFHGSVSVTGNVRITSCGFCCNLLPDPTVNHFISLGILVNPDNFFDGIIKNLSPKTTYYVKAYARTDSGIVYGNQIVINTLADSLADIDGNKYNTVVIGGQEWMAENLKVTHYRNGDPVPNNFSLNDWNQSNIGAYCFYNNHNISGQLPNSTGFGALYNWSAVSDARKLAPEGWHIASQGDWQKLALAVSNIPGKLRATDAQGYWMNGGGSNETGFSAVGAGCRISGSYSLIWLSTYFWTSTEASASNSFCYLLTNQILQSSELAKSSGFSVRCVKD